MMLPKEIRQEANKFATDEAKGNEGLRLKLIEAYMQGAIKAVTWYGFEDRGLATDDIVVGEALPCHVQRSGAAQVYIDAIPEVVEKYSFMTFWVAYDKKVGRAKAEKLWNKLSAKDRQDCIEYVPKYVEATDDKQFRKNPETFLRNRCWEDEIIYRAGGRNNGRNNNNLSANEQERMFFEQSARDIASPYNR